MDKDNKLSFSSLAVIGVMLFALFFGAGNLIFPAQLGQNAGENLWFAVTGFIITGVGLPFLGIIAMSFSGSSDLQELSSRVHPTYAVFLTSLLYLTIGPFFAAPRTGTVAYEVGIAPFVAEEFHQVGLFIYTLLFFAVTFWFSLYPSKIVDNVGKLLAPGIVILLAILLFMVVVNPIGDIGSAQGVYKIHAFSQGFIDGYSTMDALASLVFGIIVINAIRKLGVTSKKDILKATTKSGTVAIALLALIYIGIAYLGATSTEAFGIFKTGGPVLSNAASHYFGTFGLIMLAIIIILACLTTAIGLITANAEYFHKLIPRIGYKTWVVFFSILTFIIANFGLANIITFSIPVLMFIYPLAIVLMLLTFLSPLFHHARIVYASATGVTFLISIFDGLKSLCDSLGIDYFGWMVPIVSFYEQVLPFYKQGLGWFIPAIIVIIITGIVGRIQAKSTVKA
ncbi:branched-chain amino acid transport system II carrier protein [Aeribacillus pallidus]|uniref:branched-chain amino acid transport system II carrier protein n=1 Tax=Aeribacillus TaxID=1055323 RepID=UPI0007B4C243|nr:MULTISPECIES: branched-chain amino acid transport system II carrier protein [Aeribacillus]KZM54362.1 branched-chain amino acid transporter II carrier protein [Aeribacillus pallidus]MED0649528.1 branched-chain amino acid transport system II carrier protein [Aeribacillus composti]MED4486881.1 branched-chain amino acid transport system II carrier protein [Aeribacillus pallidus]